MKKFSLFFLILLIISIPQPLRNEDGQATPSLANAYSQEIPIDPEQEMQPSRVDDDDFLYDPEIISRKLFQKKLPPLPGKQKIVWSFRMATRDLLL